MQFADETGAMLDVERCSFDADHTVRMIARPPALQGARDLYAIYFHGESMMPRFEPGEVGIVDPTRPAGPGDYVLVQLNNGEEDHVTSVLVKRLVRTSARELVLEQFNPPATFTVPKARVARVHRILPQTDLLFG
jgi:phage repressor protein C with HTH and peptisase S24 domain